MSLSVFFEWNISSTVTFAQWVIQHFFFSSKIFVTFFTHLWSSSLTSFTSIMTWLTLWFRLFIKESWLWFTVTVFKFSVLWTTFFWFFWIFLTLVFSDSNTFITRVMTFLTFPFTIFTFNGYVFSWTITLFGCLILYPTISTSQTILCTVFTGLTFIWTFQTLV